MNKQISNQGWDEHAFRAIGVLFPFAIDKLNKTEEFTAATAESYWKSYESVHFEKDGKSYTIFFREDDFGKTLHIARYTPDKSQIKFEELVMNSFSQKSEVIFNSSLEDGSISTQKNNLAVFENAEIFINSI